MIRKGMDITHEEISKIISSESDKFIKRASREILGRKISELSMKVLRKVDKTFENSDVSGPLTDHFRNSISINLKPGISAALEEGGVGSNFAEELCVTINKYVTQEAYFRRNNLRKKYLLGNENEDGLCRKEIIKDIDESFKSDDLELELSETFNQEYEDLLKTQEEEIINEVTDQIKKSITDTEEKAEATRVIINEFKEVSEKIKAEQEALKPSDEKDESTEESFDFGKYDSTLFIKSKIPVTVERFNFEYDKGNLSKENMIKNLLTIEEYSTDYKDDIDYIKKRIDVIKNDAIDVKDFEYDKLNDFEKNVNSAIKELDDTFSAYRMIGISTKDEPGFKTDKDTLEVIKKMADLKVSDNKKRINDAQIILEKKVKAIESAEEFIEVSFDNFNLKTLNTDDIVDYETYKKAIEIRDEYLSDYLIDGLKHIPEARAKRLRELNQGLKKLALLDGLEKIKAERLQKIYYKTAKIADPTVFSDLNIEANRVKEMLHNAYNTEKYDYIVDDFFNTEKTSKFSTESNLYEISGYKAAMEISKKEDVFSSEEQQTKIKLYATVFSSYFKTLESIGIIDSNDLKLLASSTANS
jgi:hypothetical protein